MQSFMLSSKIAQFLEYMEYIMEYMNI